MEDYAKEFGRAAEMETKDRVLADAGREDMQKQLEELQKKLQVELLQHQS